MEEKKKLELSEKAQDAVENIQENGEMYITICNELSNIILDDIDEYSFGGPKGKLRFLCALKDMKVAMIDIIISKTDSKKL